MRNRKYFPVARVFAAIVAGGCWSLVAHAGDEMNARDAFYSAADMLAEKAAAEKPPSAPPRNNNFGMRKKKETPYEAHRKQPQPPPALSYPAPANAEAYFLRGRKDRPLGLRYSLLQRYPDGLVEANPSREFHSGDSIRVGVMGNQSGYLYIVARGASGLWKVLYPAAESSPAGNEIVPGRLYHVPGGDGEAFTFDEQCGRERLFVLFSKAPVADLDEVIRGLAAAPGNESKPLLQIQAQSRLNDDLIGRLEGEAEARDLIFTRIGEKPATEEAAPEKAVYVVNRNSRRQDARVVVEIELLHR